MIIELKITNLNDWAIIQPLLKRLKISFIQKEVEQFFVAEEPAVLYNDKETTPLFTERPATQPDLLMENAVVWSPFDAYDAAEVLLQAMKNNTSSTTN